MVRRNSVAGRRNVAASPLPDWCARHIDNPVFRTLARFLIILALALGASGPAFARAMPMTGTQATAMAPVCIGLDCSGHHVPSPARHRAMGAHCITTVCTSSIALPATGAYSIELITTAVAYQSPITLPHLGLRPIPDAPPPRSFALS